MKRTVAITGFLYFSATFIASFLSVTSLITLMIFPIIVMGFLLYNKILYYKKIIVFSLAIFLALLNFFIHTQLNNNSVNQLNNKNHETIGVVNSVILENDKINTYVLSVNKDKNEFLSSNMDVVFISHEQLSLGCVVKGDMKWESLKKEDLKDYSGMHIGKNIRMQIYNSNKVKVIDSVDNFQIKLKKLNQTLLTKTSYYLSEDTLPVFHALLYGFRDDLPKDLKTSFSITNAYHLLAISGFHIHIIAGIILFLCSFIKLHKYAANIITILFVWAYVIFCGSSFSTLRAGIMITLMLIAPIIGRFYDSLTSLSISALILLLLFPTAIHDFGFILSVLATLGVIVSTKFFYKYKYNGKMKSYLYLLIMQSIFITGGVSLILGLYYLFYFKMFNLASFIINLVLSPIVTIIISFGLLFTIIMFLPVPTILIEIVAKIIDLFINAMVAIIDFLCKLDFLIIPFRYDFIIIWLICILVFSTLIYFNKPRTNKYKQVILFAVLFFMGGLFTIKYLQYNQTEIYWVNNGNTCSIVLIKNNCVSIIKTTEDKNIDYSISKLLLSKGIYKIKNYISLFPTPNETNDTKYLINQFDVENRFVYGYTDTHISNAIKLSPLNELLIDESIPFKVSYINKLANLIISLEEYGITIGVLSDDYIPIAKDSQYYGSLAKIDILFLYNDNNETKANITADYAFFNSTTIESRFNNNYLAPNTIYRIEIGDKVTIEKEENVF